MNQSANILLVKHVARNPDDPQFSTTAIYNLFGYEGPVRKPQTDKRVTGNSAKNIITNAAG